MGTVEGPDWAAVFPEVRDPMGRHDLLTRIDAIALDDFACPPPSPGRRAGALLTETSSVLFGEVLEALLVDQFDAIAGRLRSLRLLAEPGVVLASVHDYAMHCAGSLVVRALLRRLDARRRAGILTGVTPEDRYRCFVDEAASPAGLARLTADRPDLVAWARSVIARRLDAVADLLAATDRNWTAISAIVAGTGAADRVVSVGLGTGDTHGHGRSVAVLHLDSGASVVVKPRHLGVEQAFGTVASWLGAQVGVELPQLTGWSGDGHGWVEHVGPGTAPPAPAALRATGVLLAALHLLDATDVHYENLMVDRRGLPVVVDAEALLSPRVIGTDRPDDRLLGVVATGMLSLRHEQGAQRPGEVDPGALGYVAGASSPFRSWQVAQPGRDDARLEMTAVRVDHPGPMGGAPRRAAADRDELAGGFADVLSWVLAHRERSVARIRSAMPEDEGSTVRHVQRSTMVYAQVLRMATHPDFVTRADRRRGFGRLAVLGPRTPWSLIRSEVRQLDAGDLPAFRVPLRGTVVLDPLGRDTGARCTRPPLERCLDAVGRLTDDDAAQETAAVRSSLASWDTGDGRDSADAT